jgi:gluconolactonase
MKLAPSSRRLAFVLSALLLSACAGSSGGTGTGGQGTGATGSGGSGSGGNLGTGGGATGTGGSSSGGTGGITGSGGSNTGGQEATGGNPGGNGGSGGSGTGGSGSGGTGTGGTGTGGTGTGTGGGGGTTGAAGSSGGFTPYVCPSGPFTNPNPSNITPTRVAGVPIADATINQSGYGFSNVEGPVWIGDALYISEFTNATTPPIPGHILKITSSGTVSVAIPNSGSNGLAVDSNGNLVSANQNASGIVSFSLPAGTPTTLIDSYMGMPFNCPNDLAIHTNGTIYFSDPDYQNSGAKLPRRVYRLPLGATAAVIVDATLTEPNGVTLSIDQTTLYVTDKSGLHKYPVASDGSVGAGAAFAQSAVPSGNGGDGMAIDCAGNLYVAVPNTSTLIVVSPSGNSLGTITVTGAGNVTNAAFGGTDHKTLYITAQGVGGANPSGVPSSGAQGLYEVTMPLPGMPY